MKRIIAFLIAALMVFSVFGIVSFAEDVDYHAYIDSIYSINGMIEDAAYTTRGGRNAMITATVNNIAGNDITLGGWLVADVGMSGLQYSIDGGSWQNITGIFKAREDLPSVDFLSDFDFDTVNTAPGFNNCVITIADDLADGEHLLEIRAVPKDGSTANAFVFADLTLNITNTFKATDLAWRMGNSNGSGEYTDEGYSVTTAADTPWPVVDVMGDRSLTGGVKPSIYPYAVLGVKSYAGGEVHSYSLGTLKPLRSGTSTEVTPFPMTPTEEVQYFILDLCNTGLDIIPSLTFPVLSSQGPVVYTDLIFCRSKTEAEQASLPHRYLTQTNVDYMTIDGLKYGPKASIDWMDYYWEDLPVSFRDEEAIGGYGMFHGWLASNHVVEKVGYQIDDQDPVFLDAFNGGTNSGIDAATVGTRGSTGSAMAFVIRFPLIDGTHTVKIVAKLQDSVHEYDVFADNPRGSYTYTNLESGVKSGQLCLGDSLTLSLKALFPDGTSAPGLRVTDAAGISTDLLPIGSDGDLLIFEYAGIYPQKMTDEYTFRLLDGESVIVSVPAKTFTVKQYADVLYAASADELGFTAEKKLALDVLLADLLTFGAESQIFKNYRTDSLANASEWVAAAKTPVGTHTASSVKSVNKAGTDDKFTAATLLIDNTIRFKVRFAAGSAVAVRFAAGEIEYTIPASEWTAAGSLFTALSDPIEAGYLDSVFTIDLIGEGGNVLASVTYSVESYIASGAADGSFTDALLNYGKSAAAYLAV